MLLKNEFTDNEKWWLKSVPKSHSWTDINILRFLRLYQSHPILWDITDPLYNNINSRCSTYRHIAKSLKLKNVDEKECMKLVEILKKRYIEERELYEKKDANQPAWFKIISNIIRRILNPPEITKDKEPSSESFQACRECCKNQNLSPPCCHYQASSQSTNSYQNCNDCCKAQNLNPPCKHYSSSIESIEDEKFKEYDQSKCYMVGDNDLQVMLVSFKKNEVDSEDDVDTECSCSQSSGSSTITRSNYCGKSSTDDDDDDDGDIDSCGCTSSGSRTISSSKSDFCVEDFLDQRTHDLQPNKSQSSSTITTSESDNDEKKDYNDVKSSIGIFTDSSRFHGKPISFVNEYIEFDYFDGCKIIEIIKPRRHFALGIKPDDVYPLQLDL